MSEEKKKYKNLTTYSIIMVLTAIILIIVAAMADNREELFENQLNEQTQMNINIQNDIVRLEDEKYALGKEIEGLKLENAQQKADLEFYKGLQEVIALSSIGNRADAAKLLATLITEDLSEEKRLAANTLKDCLNLPAE